MKINSVENSYEAVLKGVDNEMRKALDIKELRKIIHPILYYYYKKMSLQWTGRVRK
jgi:hypothetical protein